MPGEGGVFTGQPGWRIPLLLVLVLIVFSGLILRRIIRMLADDIRARFGLAAVILAGLLIILSVVILVRLLVRSCMRRFIFASPLKACLSITGKLPVDLVDRPNSLLVAQGLILLLLLPAGVGPVIVFVLRRWGHDHAVVR